MGFSHFRNAMVCGAALAALAIAVAPASASVIVDHSINATGAPTSNNTNVGSSSTRSICPAS